MQIFQRVSVASVTVAVLACFLVSVQRVSAQTIDHSGGFKSHDDLTANTNDEMPTNREVFVGNNIQLTNGLLGNKTSVFSNDQVDVSSFTTSFVFDMEPTSAPPADGLCFVIQNDPRGATAIGPGDGGGGGLGYSNDHPSPEPPDGAIVQSVCIKFDTYVGNPCENLGPSTTGLFLDGDSPTCPRADTEEAFYDTRPSGIILDVGFPDKFRVDLTYDGATLHETITNLTTEAQFTQDYTVDIVSHVGSGGTANVGFTGATGGLRSLDTIYSWTWQSPLPPK